MENLLMVFPKTKRKKTHEEIEFHYIYIYKVEFEPMTTESRSYAVTD